MSRLEDRQRAKAHHIAEQALNRAHPALRPTPSQAQASALQHPADGGMRPNLPGMVAALDLGASKIGCFIMRPEGMRTADNSARISGVGYVQSRGIRAGAIIDMEAASTAIAQAVERAESMANVSLSGVRVVVPGAQTASHRVRVRISIGVKPITDADLNRAIGMALAQVRFVNRKPIHLLAVSWSVDEQSGIRDPRNMTGRQLGLELLVVTIDEHVFNNIVQCVSMAHLEVQAIISSPFASAVASLEDDEMELGSIVIDMGASTTSVAVFSGGALIHVDCLNIGGGHVTSDIARGLSTTLAGAERITTLHGSAIASMKDDREMVEAPPRGDEIGASPIVVPRSILKGIIAPRLEETFELIREKLKAAHITLEPGAGIVLTGGGSQMNGVRELAVRVFDRPVRLGRSRRIPHLADAAAGPAFVSTAGVVLRTLYGPRDVIPAKTIMAGRLGPKDAPVAGSGNPVAQLMDWLRSNL